MWSVYGSKETTNLLSSISRFFSNLNLSSRTKTSFPGKKYEEYKTIVLDGSLKEQDLENVGTPISIQELLNGTQEAWSEKDKKVLVYNPKFKEIEHGFVAAVRIAYNHHISLAFSPDHLWSLIIQGVSAHVNKNGKELRQHFVNFSGKEKLKIRRDEFVKGSEENDWAGCFQEWADQIEGFIGAENKETLCPKFSTTTNLEMACTNLALMNAMKYYFGFESHTSCGIKAVKLLGKLEDWEHLYENVHKLRKYDLAWWIDDYLEPVIANIVKTYKGEEIDPLFWKSIYKHYSSNGSGTVPTVDGWIVNLFPYLEYSKLNSDLVKLETLYERARTPPKPRTFLKKPYPGMEQKDVPNGITETQFIWNYLQEKPRPMVIQSGFIGAEMQEDKDIGQYVQPVQFWAVKGSSHGGFWEDED